MQTVMTDPPGPFHQTEFDVERRCGKIGRSKSIFFGHIKVSASDEYGCEYMAKYIWALQRIKRNDRVRGGKVKKESALESHEKLNNFRLLRRNTPELDTVPGEASEA